MSELSKGRGIENYEVRQLLGKGGFACVYEGFDKTRKIEVAIKMIEQKKIKSGHMHNRVKQEVAIQFRLKHPSVLELYDVFQDSNYVYLILELCHKGQMQQYLDSHAKTLTEDEARAVMQQVIDGILYLHSHGIVHRDLSLANLLLTKDFNVKISDFGVSTTLDDPNQKHFTMCGTPNYMSPEIVTRSAHGQETDVWSLGVMLYVCLVGKRPFESGGVQSTLKRVVQGEYELPDTLSPEAKDLIKKMLRKAEDRISLQDVRVHPFMRMKSTTAKTTKKVSEMSMDSGCGTVSSTKHSSSSSYSNAYAPSRRNQPLPAFPLPQNEVHREDRSYMSVDSGSGSNRSLTYTSQVSLSDRHPQSPPVRERDSQSEEELRKSKEAMRNINKFLSKPQSLQFAAHREAEATPPAHGYQSWNEQYTAANLGANDAVKATSQHFHPLQSGDRQKAERQYPAFDPHRYKDPDASSNYNNSAFRPVQNKGNFGENLCEDQQLQQSLRNLSVDPKNIQTQDLACKVYTFLAKDETQQMLKNSQPIQFMYNDLPVQFASPEPANRKAKLTEKEIQHCLIGHKKKSSKNENKRASKEFYSLGPPLNTQGLTPVRDKANDAMLNILENGDIRMEFFTKKGQAETIGDVILISADGMQVMRYRPEVDVPAGELPPQPPEQCEKFVYPNIPDKLVKKYMYAVKMVNVLKDKLPKVTWYTPRAKCCLMETSSFHVEFYDGVKAISDGKSVQVRETDGASLTLNSAELNPRLSQETKEMLEYVQTCRDACIKIEQVFESMQITIPGIQRVYPVIFGSRPRGIKSTRKNMQTDDGKKNQGQNGVSKAADPNSALSKSRQTSTKSSTVTSAGTDSSSTHVHLKAGYGSIHDPNVNHRKMGDRVVLERSHLSETGNQSLNTVDLTSMSRVSSSPSSDCSSARVELSAPDVRNQTFVPGVGWASENTNGEKWFLYQDGTRLCLKATKIIYYSVSGSCSEYNGRDDLPAVVRQKLVQMVEGAKQHAKSQFTSLSALSLLSSSSK
ncbi:hypothetical protein BsWGS_17598 [Bradybaena similaris]